MNKEKPIKHDLVSLYIYCLLNKLSKNKKLINTLFSLFITISGAAFIIVSMFLGFGDRIGTYAKNDSGFMFFIVGLIVLSTESILINKED
jgi:hypothetical protein